MARLVLVGVVMVTALLEGTPREDVTWRPVVTIVTVGLAPVLLWRRTHPLACVVVASAPASWDSGRQIVIGLAVVAVAAVFSIATDYTGPAELFGGFAVLAAAGGAAFRYRAFVTICPDVGKARQRRISRKHERETMTSARRTPASGPVCPPPGSAIVDLPDPHHNNGAHDENTSTHHHT